MKTSSYICSFKCLGVDLLHGGCCTVADRDYIIGPVNDVDRVLKDLSKKLDRAVLREEVFIDFEEGRELFKDKKVWQEETSYPALRVDLEHSRLPCIFYNNSLKACSIYDSRPGICRNYKCDYLKHSCNE